MLETREGIASPKEQVRFREFPTNPLDRLSVLLGSFNGSPKAIAFLLTPTEGGISQKNLLKEFSDAVSGTPMEQIYPLTMWGYMDGTLVPAGLVAERMVINQSVAMKQETFFTRTGAGEKYGVPAAALTLDFENRHQVSLIKILGQTATPSKDRVRAPFVRASILLLLSERQLSLRRQDIIEELGFNQSVATAALESLDNNGLIEYSSVSRSKRRMVTYEINSGAELRSSQKARSLTDNIIAICQKLSMNEISFSSNQIEDALGEEELKRWKSNHALKNFIQKVLSNLTRTGYLRRTEFKGGEKYSNASINQNGTVVVNEFLKPLVSIVQDEPQADDIRQKLVPLVLGDLNTYARNSAEFYYPHSTSKRSEDGLTDFANIMAIIEKSNGISIRELSETLGLVRNTVINHIRIMQKLYPVVSQSKGVIKYYSIEPSLKSQLGNTELLPSIKRISANLEGQQQIRLEDKMALLIYATWALYGSHKKTAEALNITEEKVESALRQIEANDQLIQVYDEVTAEEDSLE